MPAHCLPDRFVIALFPLERHFTEVIDADNLFLARVSVMQTKERGQCFIELRHLLAVSQFRAGWKRWYTWVLRVLPHRGKVVEPIAIVRLTMEAEGVFRKTLTPQRQCRPLEVDLHLIGQRSRDGFLSDIEL